MSYLKTCVLLDMAILLAFGLFMWAVLAPKTEAQEKPFTVYETEGACVYITGGGGGPVGIAVRDKFDARGFRGTC